MRGNLKLRCKENLDGFTKNKEYKCLGSAGEFIVLEDDNKRKCVIEEMFFELIKGRR